MSVEPQASSPVVIAGPPSVLRNPKVLLTIVLVLVAGIGLYFLLRREHVQPVAEAGEFWVSVESAEVSSVTKDGKAWDIDKSGPDVFYEIWWKGNRVYKSSVCTDTLIAKWDVQEIDVVKILRTRRIEASKAGAIVKPGDDPQIVVKVFDSDITRNDTIDEYKVDLSKLKPGPNELGRGPLKQCLKLSLLMVPVLGE